VKVYYSSSICSEGKGLCGLPQRTNWQFEYAGTKRYIPVIYRFSEGIVFDIITILDEVRLRQFFEKYEAIEETLTPIQRRCAEQEHPYQDLPIGEIWINKEQVKDGYSSSGSICLPWLQESDRLIPLRKAYSSILRGVTCFACERYCVPYPEIDSKIQKLLRILRLKKVSELQLSTYPVPQFLPLDIDFEISIDDEQKELFFNHPKTGKTHILYFQKPELMEFPMEGNQNPNFYSMQCMYEIEPALPIGDTLQFGSSIQYPYTKPTEEGKYTPTCTASIGIIGGADGPTSIFISSKEKGNISCGFNGLPLYRCLSVPSFQREKVSHFILEGINTKNQDSREYNFK